MKKKQAQSSFNDLPSSFSHELLNLPDNNLKKKKKSRNDSVYSNNSIQSSVFNYYAPSNKDFKKL